MATTGGTKKASFLSRQAAGHTHVLLGKEQRDRLKFISRTLGRSMVDVLNEMVDTGVRDWERQNSRSLASAMEKKGLPTDYE